MQHVNLGGGEDEEDDGVVRTGRVTMSEREQASAIGRQSIENLSKLSEEEPNEQQRGIHQMSHKTVLHED
jgi:hypothetical protein